MVEYITVVKHAYGSKPTRDEINLYKSMRITNKFIRVLVHDAETNKYIGAGCIFINGTSAHLIDITVLESYRKQGIATSIMKYLMDNVNVSTYTLSATKNGKSLYEKLGFKDCGEVIYYLV